VSNQDGQSAPTRYESLPAVDGSSSSTEKNAVPGTNNESQPAVDDPLSSAELSTGPAWSAEQSASTSVPAPLVDFNQLLPVPHRQRPPTAKRCRKKPPTPELTSDETLKFVTDSVNKSNSVSKGKSRCASKSVTQKKNQKSKMVEADDHEPCMLCKFEYGDKKDPNFHDQWDKCSKCKRWWHETCAAVSGVYNNRVYTCDQCCAKRRKK